MTGRPTTLAFNGMIATPHYLASTTGLDILRDGGSAMDVVIAANAVLTTVYPDQTSIGGDCFLIYFEAASGRLHGLNGSGRAPARAERAALRAAGNDAMPRRGIHAVTVPGTIDAWSAALERFGRFGLDRLLQPAIGYAREGFPVSPRLSAGITAARTMLEADPATRAIYLPNGDVPRPGQRLRLPDLAATLEQIARGGRDVFYMGEIAERIDATSRRLNGPLASDDLAGHRAEWVEPVTTEYRGVTVAELPPNSQGVTALLALNLVEQVTLPDDWGAADHLHPLIEAKKLAFAVRDAELADPALVPIDALRWASKPYAQNLWRSYDAARASSRAMADVGDTVYLCAVDRDGNAASLIQSIYQGFGSGIVVDGTGIILQNRGVAFSLDDDHPNRLEPGKRPRHTLMPGMLLRDGKLLGPFGTQGGDAQAQVHLQLVTNLVDYAMEPQTAIEAPRWLAGGAPEDDPRTVELEAGFPARTIEGLTGRGHQIRERGVWDSGFGHAQMILRDDGSGLLRGGADPRADGVALGY